MDLRHSRHFVLFQSTNPCPCGYHNHPDKECMCGPDVVKRYVSKISGPLPDRIDLHVEVTPVRYDELTNMERPKLNSREIRECGFQDGRSGGGDTLQEFGPGGVKTAYSDVSIADAKLGRRLAAFASAVRTGGVKIANMLVNKKPSHTG